MKKNNTVHLPEGSTLSAMRIMDALSAVDEELLERCRRDGVRSASGTKVRRKTLWQNAGAWAAVMCMALLGAGAFGGYQFIDGVRHGAFDSGGAMDGAAQEQYAAEMNEELRMRGDQESTSIYCQGTQGDGGFDGEEAGGLGAAPKDGGQDDSAGADGSQNGMNSSSEAEGEDDLGSGKVPTTEGAQHGEDKTAQERGEEPQEEGVLTDGDMESCKVLTAEKYTLEQAAALEGLGSYVPQKLPAGYSFESAYRNLDVDETNLTISWSRGMDLLMLTVQEVSAASETADIGKPETYDVRLYEVPYAETVPQEYRQIFDDPVFAWEDMSLEIVESRMKTYADAGDTSSPRGAFSVLFSDGVLVRFNGRGTAEQIWELFCSMDAVK